VLLPVEPGNVINTHDFSSVVSSYENEGDRNIFEQCLYSVPEVMEHFCDNMLSIPQDVSCLLGKHVIMSPLTHDEQ